MKKKKISCWLRIYYLSGLLCFFNSGILLAGYNSAYVLAVKQKYAIPENVQKNDFVGFWKKTYTWTPVGNINFAIEKDPLKAFVIDASTGLITINDASKINGKIVRQDTVINLIIRTTDNGFGYEMDTAQIWVKESSSCIFIDYSSGTNGSGTRTNPFNELRSVQWSTGKMYCIKRGNIIRNETTTLNTLISNEAHPIIICAYGQGNKPKFSGASLDNGICWSLVATPDETTNRIEYMYFYDLWIRAYPDAAYKVRRTDNHMGWYNCETYNCNRLDLESSFIISTSSYSDSTKYIPFEIINYVSDTTSSGCPNCGPGNIEPSHIKCGVGPVTLINSYFGKSQGWSVRIAAGNGSILKHCVFDNQLSCIASGYNYSVQIRQDYAIIEDCRFIGSDIGVYITAAGDEYEMPPDYLHIKNCYFKDQRLYGIWEDDQGAGYKAFHNNIFEDNLMENVATGIKEEKGVNTIIRRNKLYMGSGNGILTGTSSFGMSIYDNIIYGYSGDEIYLPVGSKITIYNNTVDGDINCNGSTSAIAKNNLYRKLSGISDQANNLDIGTITRSEYFENDVDNDYRLKVSATNAINKGTDVGISSDFAGNLINGMPDIGALEFAAILNTPVINHSPEIHDQEFTLSDQNFNNLFVGQVVASDEDAGQKLVYSIISGNESGIFELNAENGELKTTKANIFKTESQEYQLTVKVTDNGVNQLSSSALTHISILGQPKDIIPIITVYPNPTTGIVNVEIETDYTKVEKKSTSTPPVNKSEIKLLDMAGKTIISKPVEFSSNHLQENIDLSVFPNGEYLILFKLEDKILSEKIILNR